MMVLKTSLIPYREFYLTPHPAGNANRWKDAKHMNVEIVGEGHSRKIELSFGIGPVRSMSIDDAIELRNKLDENIRAFQQSVQPDLPTGRQVLYFCQPCNSYHVAICPNPASR